MSTCERHVCLIALTRDAFLLLGLPWGLLGLGVQLCERRTA